MTEERIDGEETKEKKKPKKSLKRELMEDVIMIVFVLVTVWVMKNYVLINAVIPSASMEDTIMTGDRIFGSRLSYEFGEPQRGDIAIFKFPDDESQLYIKRVIGLPGDKVQIIDGTVYINDSETPLDEPYLPEPALTFKLSDTVRTKGKFWNDSTTSISHLIFSNYRVLW